MDKSRLKYLGMLTFLSFIISTIMKTKYPESLADKVFSLLSIESWSDGTQGLHYTVIVGLLVIILIYVVYNRRYDVPIDLGFGKSLIYVLIIAACFSYITNGILGYTLKFNEGLEAIERLDTISDFSMKNMAGDFNFDTSITFRNHSDDDVRCYIDFPFPFDYRTSYISIRDFNDGRVIFTIPANSTITIDIDENDYLIVGDFEGNMGSSSNGMFPVVLTNLEGDSYLYDEESVLGVVIANLP